MLKLLYVRKFFQLTPILLIAPIAFGRPCTYNPNAKEEKEDKGSQSVVAPIPPLLKLLYEAELARSKATTIETYKSKIAEAITLIRDGADLTVWDQNKCSALLIAAQNGEEAVVEEILLKLRQNPKARETKEYLKKAKGGGPAPWVVAQMFGHPNIVTRIVESQNYLSPKLLKEELEFASKLFGATRTPKEFKAQLDAVPQHIWEQRALDAEIVGHADVTQFGVYLEKVKDINRMTNYGLSLLGTAAHMRRKDLVRILLLKGADPNLDPFSMRGPLMWAINFRDVAMSQLLLDKGANPNIGDDGVSPLLHATAVNDLAHVRLLLNRKYQLNLEELKTSTMPYVRFAIANAKNPEILKLLLDAGANPNLPTNDESPLALAAASGDLQSVRILLNPAYKTEVNPSDPLQFHPIDEALRTGNKEIFIMLLDAGAQVNRPGGEEMRTLLHDVALKRPKWLPLLLDKKYKVNFKKRDRDGLTARDILVNNITKKENLALNQEMLALMDKAILENSKPELPSKSFVAVMTELKSQGYEKDSPGMKALFQFFETMYADIKSPSESKLDQAAAEKIKNYLNGIDAYLGKNHPFLKLSLLSSIEGKTEKIGPSQDLETLISELSLQVQSELKNVEISATAKDLELFHRFSNRVVGHLSENQLKDFDRDRNLLVEISKSFKKADSKTQEDAFNISLRNLSDFYSLYEKTKSKEVRDLFYLYYRDVLSDRTDLPASVYSKVFRYRLDLCDLGKTPESRENELKKIFEFWGKSEKSVEDREAAKKCYELPTGNLDDYSVASLSQLVECRQKLKASEAETCTVREDCLARDKKIARLEERCERDAKELRELRAMNESLRKTQASSPLASVTSACSPNEGDRCSPLSGSPTSLSSNLSLFEEKKVKPIPVFSKRKVWIHRTVNRQIKALSEEKTQNFNKLALALRRKGTDFTEFCKDPEKFTQVTAKVTLLHCHLKGPRPISVVAWCEDAGEIQIVKVADHPDGNDYSEWMKDLPGKCLAKDKLSLLPDSNGSSDDQDGI